MYFCLNRSYLSLSPDSRVSERSLYLEDLAVTVPSKRAFNEPKRIRKRDRVIPRVRVQINPAREPDGILGQKPPI